MDNKKMFHELFVKMNYPKYIDEEFTYNVFEFVLFELSDKIDDSMFNIISDSKMILSYIIGEINYLFSSSNEDKRNDLIKDNEFINAFSKKIVDKIFFNEYYSYNSIALIDKYNPLISSLRLYLNFILDKFTTIQTNQKIDLIILGMLRKAFLSCRSITSLLIEGFETEAFSTWRTIHETECIVKILFDHPYISSTYERHLLYISAFRNEIENKEYQQMIIDEIKKHLKEHNLKSKDLKKYIEYGWIYSIENIEEKYPGIKLNFRNGIELVASLTEYSKLYEMSSEIAHSSPILIYSNKEYFLKKSIICVYETFLRLEKIFCEILKRTSNADLSGFLNIRNVMISELNLYLEKEKK